MNKIYVAYVDGLKGFPEAIVQLCIVHMVRNSVKYVSYKDLKAVTAYLKAVYSAINEVEGLRELQNFAKNGMKNIQLFLIYGNEIGLA